MYSASPTGDPPSVGLPVLNLFGMLLHRTTAEMKLRVMTEVGHD